MKSKTKEPAGKDEFWIVDNQLTFNKMQVLADSLRFDRKYILIPELVPSTHYNVTTKEVYAVPIVEKNVYGPFCYANREEGIYWVEPPKVARTYRSCKHVAYLPNLCVNERQNSVVAALRFFNQIDFYDLKGTYQRSFTYGKEPIVPLLKKNDKMLYRYIRYGSVCVLLVRWFCGFFEFIHIAGSFLGRPIKETIEF